MLHRALLIGSSGIGSPQRNFRVRAVAPQSSGETRISRPCRKMLDRLNARRTFGVGLSTKILGQVFTQFHGFSRANGGH
jgi:hypothetical protein